MGKDMAGRATQNSGKCRDYQVEEELDAEEMAFRNDVGAAMG